MNAPDSSPPDGPFPEALGLFPLPNVVFLPFTLLRLHVFEPRYRKLLADALENDRRICMGFLKPGWESSYYGSPEVLPIGCVGQIHAVEKLPDGRSNIALLGLARVQILECADERPYRRVRVRVVPDVYRDAGETDERDLARRVVEASDRLVEALGADPIDWGAGPEIPPGAILDRAGGLFELGVEEKLGLLQEARVAERGEILLGLLRARLQIALQTRALDGSDRTRGFTPN